MSNRLILAPEAREDIKRTLAWSIEHFGVNVRDGYEELIAAAIADVVNDPARPGSHDRPDLGQGVRSWHLALSREHVSAAVRRIGKPRYFVIYRQVGDSVHVDRLLHDAMEVRRWRLG